MNNNLLKMQEMLMRQMERLDEGKNNEDMNREVARSNALSQSANTFIKSVNVGLRIKEIADKQQITVKSINKELGIENEK